MHSYGSTRITEKHMSSALTFSTTLVDSRFNVVVLPDGSIVISYRNTNGIGTVDSPVIACRLVPRLPHALLTNAFYYVQCTYAFESETFSSPPASVIDADSVFRIDTPLSIREFNGTSIDSQTAVQVASPLVRGLRLASSSEPKTLRFFARATGTPTISRICHMSVRDITPIGEVEPPKTWNGSSVWRLDGVDTSKCMIGFSEDGRTIELIAKESFTLYPNQILVSLVQKANAVATSKNGAFLPFLASLAIQHGTNIATMTTNIMQQWRHAISSSVGVIRSRCSATTVASSSSITCTAASTSLTVGATTTHSTPATTHIVVSDTTAIIDEWALLNTSSSSGKTHISTVGFQSISYNSFTGLREGKTITFVNENATATSVIANEVLLTLRWISPGSWVARNDTTHLLFSPSPTPAAIHPTLNTYLYNLSNGFIGSPLRSEFNTTGFATTNLIRYTMSGPTGTSAAGNVQQGRFIVGSANTAPSISERFRIRMLNNVATQEVSSRPGIHIKQDWLARTDSTVPGLGVASLGDGVQILAFGETIFPASVDVPVLVIEQTSPARPMVVALLVEPRSAAMAQATITISIHYRGAPADTYVTSAVCTTASTSVACHEIPASIAGAKHQQRTIVISVATASRFVARSGVALLAVTRISPPDWFVYDPDAPTTNTDAITRIGSAMQITNAATNLVVRNAFHDRLTGSLSAYTVMSNKTVGVSAVDVHVASNAGATFSMSTITKGAVDHAWDTVCTNDRWGSRVVPAGTTLATAIDPLTWLSSFDNVVATIQAIQCDGTGPFFISSTAVTPYASAYRSTLITPFAVIGSSGEFTIAPATNVSLDTSSSGTVAVRTTTATSFSTISTFTCTALNGLASSYTLERAIMIRTYDRALRITRNTGVCTIRSMYNITNETPITESSSQYILPENSNVQIWIRSIGRLATGVAADITISLQTTATIGDSVSVFDIESYQLLPRTIRASSCWMVRRIHPSVIVREGPLSNLLLIWNAGATMAAGEIIQLQLLSYILPSQVSTIRIGGTVRPLISNLDMRVNTDAPTTLSSSIHRIQETSDPLPSERSISLSLTEGRSDMYNGAIIASIDHLSPPDPFLAASSAPATALAFLSPSSVPEALGTLHIARTVLFGAPSVPVGTTLSMAVSTGSTLPTVTTQPGGAATTTRSRVIGSLPNVVISSSSALGIVDVSFSSDTTVAVRRCSSISM